MGLVFVVLLAAAVYRFQSPVTQSKAGHRVSEVGLTPNEAAASGPRPGDGGASARPGAQAQGSDAKSFLKAMSDYVSSQQTIELTFDSDIEVITPQLEKIQPPPGRPVGADA